MSLKEVDIYDLQINPMKMIGDEWMLVTAGNETNGFNTMTASWGHLGSLWERKGGKAHRGLATATVYVRPQRYTKEFMDREDIFSLCVFEDKRKELAYLGSHSGRDENKIEKAGLTPLFLEETTAFEEAKLILICKKIYSAPIVEEGFVDKNLIENNYKKKDFHQMYIGEIIKAYINE